MGLRKLKPNCQHMEFRTPFPS